MTAGHTSSPLLYRPYMLHHHYYTHKDKHMLTRDNDDDSNDACNGLEFMSPSDYK
jgi:hypothetical protein